MPVGKASIMRAASAGSKGTAENKTGKAAVKKSTVSGGKKTAPAAESVVKQSVLTPMNAEEIQVKFLSGKKPEQEPGRPVRIMEELPDYLL